MRKLSFLARLCAALPVLGGIASRLSAAPQKAEAMGVASEDFDADTFLWAVSQIETHGDDRRRGPMGERSKYQITSIVWKQWRPVSPFDLCHGNVADKVAREHLAWLRQHLPDSHYSEQYALAWCWKNGLASWRKYLASSRADYGVNSYYATRVAALYRDVRNPKPIQ